MIHESNEFLLMIEKPADGSQPAIATAFSLGASNVMGAYSQILDGSSDWPADAGDGFGIFIHVSSINASGTAHPALVTIGIDRAGGTTYTDWIENLIVCDASVTTGHCGVVYFFPIRIPNGCSLAIKGQDANASPLATSRCFIRIPCKPTRPELVRVGTFVQSFGVDTANSAGTAYTPGTVSEGAYTQLGAALDKPIWYWEYGVATTSTALQATGWWTDIAVGDASNKRRVICNSQVWTDTSEVIIKPESGAYGDADVGEMVYVRTQIGDNGGPTGPSAAAYGVGG